jgi:hypothetical protein
MCPAAPWLFPESAVFTIDVIFTETEETGTLMIMTRAAQ